MRPVAVSTTKWSGLTAAGNHRLAGPGARIDDRLGPGAGHGIAVNSTPAVVAVHDVLDDDGEAASRWLIPLAER